MNMETRRDVMGGGKLKIRLHNTQHLNTERKTLKNERPFSKVEGKLGKVWNQEN